MGLLSKVHGELVQSDRAERLIPSNGPSKACPLCRLGLELSFMDVLILRQFMRNDGTVLPQRITGLCNRQQMIVERLVMQAHWSGLFPTLKPNDFDYKEASEGYKKYNRYWKSHTDMYSKKITVKPGSFYYIKRY
ncbi:Ribosomal S18 domain containing protein [Trichuris trichiura]|uniref:Ribosomal S18 domain containing protein n=1 Tax=Trichuris trichiura TaxID=36087 RepID=A0A077ZI49_TRITR|nr:Ribosomal S18 domain containing protein [Trichuris trichiura]